MTTLAILGNWIGIIAIAVGSGYAILRMFCLPSSSPGEAAVMSGGLGLGLLMYGTAGLGILQRLNPPFVTAGMAAVAMLALWGGLCFWREQHGSGRQRSGDHQDVVYPAAAVYVALGLFAVVYLLSAMVPPLDGDTIHSYLDVPKQFVVAGGIVPLPYELHSILPLNLQMLSALSLMISGDELAQMMAGFTMATGAALVVYLMGTRYLSREVGAVGALLFYSMNVTQSLMPTAKVNLGWAFFDLLAVYVICRWGFESRRNDRWLALAGVFGGIALGTQYNTFFTGLGLSLVIMLVSARRGGYVTMKRLAVFILPVCLLAAPWLLRNLLETGNPVFPIFNSVFGLSPVEFVEQASGFTGMFKIPWDISTGYTAGGYGEPVGPLVLAVLPAIFALRHVDRKVKIGLVFAAFLFLLWFSGVQRPRNFLTGLAILSLVSAYIYVELGRSSRFLRRGIIVLSVIFLLFGLGSYTKTYFVNLGYTRYILGLETRDEFLVRNLDAGGSNPSWAMVRYMNEKLPPQARVVGLYLGNGYYVDRPFIDSRMVDGNFSMDTASDAESLVSDWKKAGVTDVFINKPYVRRAVGDDPSIWKDYMIINEPDFESRWLREEFRDGEQYLYRLVGPE